ncbi:MAG: kinase [Rhodospirillales bacterium]|nr:kinase [Rhodospirillales bacterium]MBO6786842.1 kinase [Rhodospirillales bacterium]
MIICRTPFRVSLFGGGTDYPKWYEQHGGAVLGFAIDKYCYISVRRLPPFFEHKHRIVYSVVENVKSIDEIQHPAVKGVLSEHKPDEGVEIHHDGDLPARSGLGSSSSFTVGLTNALAAFKGKMISKRDLAREAIRIEHEVINEKVGCQDQIWAAYGGLNRIDFLKTGDFDVQPVMVDRDRREDLQDHLLLVFTGLSRLAPVMAEKQIENIDAREKQLSAMHAMVDEAQAILVDENRPITDVGKLLDQSWQLKRELADGVTTPLVDEIYEAAMGAGASGGKLLGAGGGGFMLFIVAPEKQAKVRAALKDLVSVKIGIDNVGSKIVVYEPDGLEYA